MGTDYTIYLIAGIGLFLAGAIPLLRFSVVSTAMAFVATGVVAGLLPLPLPGFLPEDNRELILRLTEVTVIVALMGAGLSIDRRPGLRSWAPTWRLLALTMPLCIASIALLGWSLLGLAPAAAVLLGAVLAPTDPVLAADVRVAGPNSDDEDVTRLTLTSEAGLNDGLAFPFVYLALLMVAGDMESVADVGKWLAWDLVGKVAIGIVVGIVIGRLLALLAFRSPAGWLRLSESNEGILALAVTFTSYGVAEALHGWGFIAVFVAGLSIRAVHNEHDYHTKLHDFTHQIERLLTLAALLMFGVACGSGLLDALTWAGFAIAVLLVVVIRPLAGMVSLIGCSGTWAERFAKACFGVRGIGSFYYLAYAFGEESFTDESLLWSTVSAAVLVSVVVHGATSAPAMRYLDRQRDLSRSAPDRPPEGAPAPEPVPSGD
ncbi:MAG: cation:proton antiporter [Nocardioides sp.]